jgi:hypothetical protein
MAARWFGSSFSSPSSSIAVFCSGVVAVGVRWWMPAASAIYERNKDRTERERGPFCRRKCIRTNEITQINHNHVGANQGPDLDTNANDDAVCFAPIPFDRLLRKNAIRECIG